MAWFAREHGSFVFDRGEACRFRRTERLAAPVFSRLRAGGHPGGFYLSLVATDRLAIHPGHPLDFALTGAAL